MMPLDDKDRFVPNKHGHSNRPRVIDPVPTRYSESLSHLPTIRVSLDPTPEMPVHRDPSLLPLPIGGDTRAFPIDPGWSAIGNGDLSFEEGSVES